MPNYRRPKAPGAMIFFTLTLADRGSDLLVREVDLLREAVRATRTERPFHIDAWVILPDHLHCIWTLPDGDRDFSTRWRIIKSRFSRGIATGTRRQSHVTRGECGIWQRRYWEHHIRDEADYNDHMRYCWWNPVKHGLVKAPEKWAYSSFRRDRARGLVG